MKTAVQRLHFNVGPIGTVEQVTMPVILGTSSGLGGRVSGPDLLQKTEGKIFGIIFTSESSLQIGLASRP